MWRLHGILRAAINVTLMTLSIHSTGQVFRCSHFPVGTKTPKNLACGASLATSPTGTESAGMQELLKDALVHLFPHRHRRREYSREKLIWCGLTHSSTVTHARGSHNSVCLETWPWLAVPLGAEHSWKSARDRGAQHLNVSYTTSPLEKTEFLRLILNSFQPTPPTCPWLWITLPLRNRILEINPNS